MNIPSSAIDALLGSVDATKDTLEQLADLFVAIDLLIEKGNVCGAKNLAKLGQFVCDEMAHLNVCSQESFTKRMPQPGNSKDLAA